MCNPQMLFLPYPLPGHRYRQKPVVVYRRLHRFASARWLNAKNPKAARFWSAVMKSCVGEITVLEDTTDALND